MRGHSIIQSEFNNYNSLEKQKYTLCLMDKEKAELKNSPLPPEVFQVLPSQHCPFSLQRLYKLQNYSNSGNMNIVLKHARLHDVQTNYMN